MLGTCNVRTISDVGLSDEINATVLEFIAGEDLSKSDIVEIISEGLPIDKTDYKTVGGSFMPYTNDTKGDNYTWSRPKHLKSIHKMHCFHLNTNPWQTGYLHLYHCNWPDDAFLTYDVAVADEGVATPISAIQSCCWGEPIEIEENWWLIPAQGSNSTTVTDSTNTLVDKNPSCVYLVYIDPETGRATRKFFLAIQGGYNNCSYGKPFILQMSETEFIFIHKTLINGVYAISALPFKVNIHAEDEQYMDWLTRDPQLVYFTTSDFQNFGATCHFVDKEHGKAYFLGQAQWTYWELRYNKDRTGFEEPRSNTFIPQDRIIKEWRSDLNYNNYPTVQSYYNDLSAGCNMIHCSDGKHLLWVNNHYYHDFAFTPSEDNEVIGTISDIIYPLERKGVNTRVLSQSFGTNGNYNVDDWEIATRFGRSRYCNSTTGTNTSKLPWLCKMSNNKYAMAYSSMLTNNIESTTINEAWLGTPMVILDFCDELHRLDCNTHYTYNSYVYNTSYPEVAYQRPFVFLDGKNRLQRLVSRYHGSYYNQGQNYHQTSSLPTSSMELIAYKIGTKLEDDNTTIYCTGRVLQPAASGTKAKILAFINEKEQFKK